MPKLIGIAGKARVGKDTTANFICKEFWYERYAFADPIKAALGALGFPREIYDTDEMKERVIPEFGVSYRKMAQTLGTEWGRGLHQNFWLLLAKRKWESLHEFCPGLVITDVRFENEAQWIREAGGTVFHVVGPARAWTQEGTSKHASEAGIERLPDDVIISNVATLDFLRLQVTAAVESL